MKMFEALALCCQARINLNIFWLLLFIVDFAVEKIRFNFRWPMMFFFLHLLRAENEAGHPCSIPDE
jgi:hypothetical protein